MNPALARVASRIADPPLDPSPDQARSWLRRELIDPDYHDQDLLQRMVTWLERAVDRGLAAAQGAPPLTTLASMTVLVLLVAGLAWLVSRARGSARASRPEETMLGAESLSAAALRARAEQALAEGRHEDALLDGFRALAVRQVERRRLDDSPGATAHEVAASLGAAYPAQRARVDDSARLFDLVLYGHRHADREQARQVLALDEELAR